MARGKGEIANERTQPLSRSEVIAAALKFIDTHGEDQLTMRKLAEALDVFPTTIYWHAGNRATLVAAVCEQVFAQIDLPPTSSLPWQDWIKAMGHAVRRTLLVHPNIVPPLRSQMQATTSSFPFIDAVLTVLGEAGFGDDDLAVAYNATMNSVFGFVFGELNSDPSGADPDWRSGFRRHLESVDPEVTPALARALPRLANNAFMLRWVSGIDHPLDRSFDFTLEILVSGLAAQIGQ